MSGVNEGEAGWVLPGFEVGWFWSKVGLEGVKLGPGGEAGGVSI